MADATAVTVWLAVLTGCATVAATSYGLFLSVAQRRLGSVQRLNEAAAIAVRRTEAMVVRPLLRDRLLAAVEEGASDPAVSADPLRSRMRLFVELQRRMTLTAAEKHAAHRAAVANLVTQLRASPNPPLRVASAADLSRHAVRLSELVENAYNLRPRPAGEMIRSLGDFCRGVAAAPPAAGRSHRPTEAFYPGDASPVPSAGSDRWV